MSAGNEQNGRQPPLPPNQPPLSDPRLGNVPEHQKPICRKYVWGTCNKGPHCKFRHELVFEEMKKILKFCHDHQNKQGCTRVDCSYLHTSSEEENLFLTTGQLPRVLQERYITMQAETSSSCLPNFEGVPQMLFAAAPPPPPPPPAPMIVAAPPPPPPPRPAPFPPVQQPPPPPPPTVPSTSAVQTAPAFTAPPPQQTAPVFPVNQPPPALPLLFDASRPPPPLPGQVKNGAVKRKLDHSEAGPSKLSKPDEPKADNPCELCIQREIRIDVCKQQMEKLQCEEEYQRLLYKMKLEEYENSKQLLRSLDNPELYRILEDYIEGGPPPVQDIFAHLTQNPFILLMEYLFHIHNSSRNSVDTTTSSLRLDETLLQALGSLPRRTSPVRPSPSSELVQAVLEILRNANSTPSERSQAIESRTNETQTLEGNRTSSNISNNVNGFSRFANGQTVELPTVTTTANTARYSNVAGSTSRVYSGAGVPGPSGLGPSTALTPTVASAVYPPYHPGIPPPPNRPYYTPQYATNIQSTPSSFNPPLRMSAPGPSQMPVRPSTSAAAPAMPPNAQNYNHYMGRYPHPPHYYPPYQ